MSSVSDHSLSVLEKLLIDDIKPNHLSEVEWLMQYMSDGAAYGPPLFLSLGENWRSTPAKLVEKLATVPDYAHGYQLSMFGLPALRHKLKAYVKKDYNLDDQWDRSGAYNLAVAQTGTRAVMHDFSLWFKENHCNGKTPTLLMAAPGWDYTGVFKATGYDIQYFDLHEKDGFYPNVDELSDLIKKIDNKKNPFVFALNCQQNPTALNWKPGDVQKILWILIEKDIPVLIDDAYYAVTEPGIQPTAALKILLKLLDGDISYTWLLVRSMGKQFSCNGWGIGFYMGCMALLDSLANAYQVRRHYNTNGVSQCAMAEWVESDESYAYLDKKNRQISDNRNLLINGIIELGWPKERIFKGNCTSFQMFPIPKKYESEETRTHHFIKDCIFRAGILMTDAWPVPYNSHTKKDIGYARIFLGVESNILHEMIDRLSAAKIFF